LCLASVRLNEALPGPGSDWNGDLDSDSRSDEWAEITNQGSSPVDLTDYLLLSGDRRSPVYGFSGQIEPGDFLMISGSDALDWESENGHSSIGLSLNNGGDVVYLATVSGSDTLVVDSLRYESAEVGYDVSIGRLADGSGEWTCFDHFMPLGGCGLDPTPGAGNTTNPGPHILGLERVPLYPAAGDSITVRVDAGDADGVTEVLLAYDINLEDGEEPHMILESGTDDLGTWVYTILPCAAGDTVHYRVSLSDGSKWTVSPWMGCRVREGGVSVVINEFLADPPPDLAGDANRDGVRHAADDEFVELLNCGVEPRDISGWTIGDGTSVRHVFPDTGLVVMPGEFVTVFGGGEPIGFEGEVSIASSGGLGLANSGDAVKLLDSSGNVVDIHSYGSEGGRDQAIIRYPDCSDSWMRTSEAGLESPFSPQGPNDATAAVVTPTWGNIKALFR
jgi:hypothetical protein